MTSKLSDNTYMLLFLFLSFILTLMTLSNIGASIEPTLDSSYKFAFNYFFEHHIQCGRDILFTLGPLGFIYAPMPIGNHILFATIITFIVKFIFLYLSFTLYKSVRKEITPYQLSIFVLLLYIIANISIHHIILFIPLLLILLYDIHHQRYLLYVIGIFTVFALLIKASTGITTLLFLISYTFYTLYKKEYHVPIILLFITTILFLLSWFLLYNNLSGIYDYVYATLEFSKGNSSIMTINPDNNWFVFTCFVFLFLLYPILQKDKIVRLLYFISLLTTAAIFKFSMSREDHIFEFENYLFDFIFIVFLVSKNFHLKHFFSLLFMYLSFLGFIYFTPWENKIHHRLVSTHIPHLPFHFIDISKRKHFLIEKSKLALKTENITDKILQTIGNSTVDTYPTLSTVFYNHPLHWKPRPIFQSYITYTNYLDTKNALFFNTLKAPSYILWSRKDHLHSIDGRYLLNNNPQTLFAIFNHYTPIIHNNKHILFKHTQKNILSTTPLKTEKYTWNTWITVPPLNTSYSYLLAKTIIQRSFIQKIKKLIYKEFEIIIEYKLYNGEVVSHRLNIDTSAAGIWVNPLPKKLFNYPITRQVEAIRFIHNDYDYFQDDITITWEKVQNKTSLFSPIQSQKVDIPLRKYNNQIQYHIDKYNNTKHILDISGWAFIQNALIDDTKKYIILVNKTTKKHYIYATFNEKRTDITQHFTAKDLSTAGFNLHLNKHHCPKGTYTLELLLIKPDQTQYRVTLEKKLLVP